jgi:Kef-type K+ transport system membrane component KefB
LTPWVNYLAGLSVILLTFLAGAEIDINVVRRHFASTLTIGAVGFFAPYLGVLAFAHFVSGWPLPQAQIAGIAPVNHFGRRRLRGHGRDRFQ